MCCTMLCLVAQSCPTLCNPMDCPWNSPGQKSGVGSLSLLQGIFPTQRLNPGLPHCRQILYCLSHQGSPRILEWVAYPFSGGSSQPRNRTGSPALEADSLPSEPPEKPLFNPSNLEKSPFARLAGLCRITCVLSHSVISDSLQPHGLWPTRLLCPWGFSRQEHSSGLPCPSPGDLPNPR